MLTNILSISFAAAIIYYVSRTRSRWCCVHPAAQFCVYYYFLTIFRACALAQSVVLPPGDWEKKNILPLNEIMELRRKRQAMKYAVLTGGAPPPPPSQVRP